MAENILRRLFERGGVEHEGDMRSHMREAIATNLRDIDARYRAGLISREVGLAATRRVYEAAMEESTRDMESYVADRNSGAFEATQRMIKDWDETKDDHISAQERDHAMKVILQQRADEMLTAGTMSGDDYQWTSRETGFAPSEPTEAEAEASAQEPQETASDWDMQKFVSEREAGRDGNQ